MGYNEAMRAFGSTARGQIQIWKRSYLAEGITGFQVERRGRGSKGHPAKLPPKVEEDLFTEVQRLRAENAYLKNLQALVLEDERQARKNAGNSRAEAH